MTNLPLTYEDAKRVKETVDAILDRALEINKDSLNNIKHGERLAFGGLALALLGLALALYACFV